jgi:DinB family
MLIRDFLLEEFDTEMQKTRATLERVPTDNKEFAPHAKPMPLTTPYFDFSQSSIPRLPFESPAQLVGALDELAAKARAALATMSDDAWTEHWRLSFGEKTIFEGSRFLAYREMFLNHLVHHRAQLGVYLRLNGKPVPATYGPSADDKMGF